MDTARQPTPASGQNVNDTSHAAPEPIDRVQEHLSTAGVHARGLREVLRLLVDSAPPFAELVRGTGLPRKTVEELLAAAGTDVEVQQDSYRLAPAKRQSYRERFDLYRDEPASATLRERTLARIQDFIETGPHPRTALDHVTATAETVLHRAEWLRDHYELRGAHVLCLGDHDLTSLAICLVEPSARVTAVDVDERVLAHLDALAVKHGFALRTWHADFRFGVPPRVLRSADLVFTDPPYTPEGVGLFAARAAGCLADSQGRVLIAYGFSDRAPALGNKVQRELLRLGLAFQAILPGFHRYHGAQAIGSSSDLYVCQPTAQARKLGRGDHPEIYTHGPQSVEATRQALSPEFAQQLEERLGSPVGRSRSPNWHSPLNTTDSVPIFDLRADPGPWLLRTMLACNAEKAAFLVHHDHPDMGSAKIWNGFIELLATKYELRVWRGVSEAKHVVIIAETAQGNTVSGRVLHRAHGKVGNTWRDALIACSDHGLTQREALELVHERAPHRDDLDARLIDLPQHRLVTLIAALS